MNSLDDQPLFESLNFILDRFETYFYAHEVPFKEIDKLYIQNYIMNDSTISASTMIQRRALFSKFLLFIDKTLNIKLFKSVTNDMKVYKKTKGTIFKSKTIDKELVERIYSFIDSYTNNQSLFLKRVTKQSEYVAYRDSAMILLMLGSGCRASEVLSLRYCDIEDIGSDTYKIHILNGKGNKQRTTYILKSLFEKHFIYLNKYKKSDKDIIALSQNGVQVNRRNLYKTVTKIFTYLGESKQGLHIFRHHFGSNFAQTNGNIKILQDLLGHSSISTTMIYSSVAEDAKERAISLQENIS